MPAPTNQPTYSGRVFLRRPALLAKVGFRTTKLYDLVKRGEFPRPVKIGSASLWDADAVEAWMAERAAHQPLAV